MENMRENRILVPFLVLATVAVDAAVLCQSPAARPWPGAYAAVLLGMACGQVNLATIWAVLGRRMLAWRLAALVTVPIGWSFAIALAADFRGVAGYTTAGTWAVHLLVQAGLLATVLLAVRLSGARLSPGRSAGAGRRGRPHQFTLGRLFGWMTASAIALSALKSAFGVSQPPNAAFDWRGILVLGAVSAAIGLGLVWGLLDTRPMFARWAAALVSAVPAAWAIGYAACVADGSRLRAILLLWLVVAIYSSVAMGVLRIAGYRAEWLTAPIAS